MGSWSLVVCRSLSFPKLGSMEVSMYFVAASKLHQLRFSSWLLAWNDFLVHKLVFAWLTSETFLLLKVPFFSILCLLSSNVPTTKPTTTTKRLCWQQTRIIRYLIIFRYSIFQLFQTQFHACLIKKNQPTSSDLRKYDVMVFPHWMPHYAVGSYGRQMPRDEIKIAETLVCKMQYFRYIFNSQIRRWNFKVSLPPRKIPGKCPQRWPQSKLQIRFWHRLFVAFVSYYSRYSITFHTTYHFISFDKGFVDVLDITNVPSFLRIPRSKLLPLLKAIPYNPASVSPRPVSLRADKQTFTVFTWDRSLDLSRLCRKDILVVKKCCFIRESTLALLNQVMLRKTMGQLSTFSSVSTLLNCSWRLEPKSEVANCRNVLTPPARPGPGVLSTCCKPSRWRALVRQSFMTSSIFSSKEPPNLTHFQSGCFSTVKNTCIAADNIMEFHFIHWTNSYQAASKKRGIHHGKQFFHKFQCTPIIPHFFPITHSIDLTSKQNLWTPNEPAFWSSSSLRPGTWRNSTVKKHPTTKMTISALLRDKSGWARTSVTICHNGSSSAHPFRINTKNVEFDSSLETLTHPGVVCVCGAKPQDRPTSWTWQFQSFSKCNTNEAWWTWIIWYTTRRMTHPHRALWDMMGKLCVSAVGNLM